MRTYTVDGAKLPSVTSVLGAVWPKDALTRWKIRGVAGEMADLLIDTGHEHLDPADRLPREDLIDLAVKRFEEKGERVAARGSRVHAWAEAHVLGQPLPPLGDGEEGFAKACLAWHEAHPGEMVASEMKVTNGEWAGTLDGIKKLVSGELVIIDYKTSAKHGNAWPDQAAQLGAYSLCRRAKTGTRWQEVSVLDNLSYGVVIRLCADGYDETEVRLPAARSAWLRAWDMWLQVTSEAEELWR